MGVGAILTLGHGTLPADELTRLALGAGVAAVADVRRFPGSRRHPQFSAREMAVWLPEAGIGYRGIPALGGRRPLATASPNSGLRNQAFRGYADHMATAEFGHGVGELLELASERTVAVLCAESLWWRCHRRLLADHLVVVLGLPVHHLFHDGRVVPHPPTPEARPAGDHVVYDVTPQGALFPSGEPPAADDR